MIVQRKFYKLSFEAWCRRGQLIPYWEKVFDFQRIEELSKKYERTNSINLVMRDSKNLEHKHAPTKAEHANKELTAVLVGKNSRSMEIGFVKQSKLTQAFVKFWTVFLAV